GVPDQIVGLVRGDPATGRRQAGGIPRDGRIADPDDGAGARLGEDAGAVAHRGALVEHDDRRRGAGRKGVDAGTGVACRVGVFQGAVARAAGRVRPEADAVVDQGRPLKRNLRAAADNRFTQDAGGVLRDDRVLDLELGARLVRLEIDARLSEAVNASRLDVQRLAGEEADAVQPGGEAVDVQTAQGHDVARARADDDPVRPRHHDSRGDPFGGDGQRLGDGDGAETTRIEDVDLADGRRLREGACEGLAGGGAAARVGVVADPGDPGAGRLGVRGGCEAEQGGKGGQRERGLSHEDSPVDQPDRKKPDLSGYYRRGNMIKGYSHLRRSAQKYQRR